MEETEVVVVGGGPAGLVASLCLSHFGIRHVLLERHPGTSIYPRAIGINQRSMELFRFLGIDDAIAAQAAPAWCTEKTAWYTSFDGPTSAHGKELGSRNSWGGGVYREEYAAASPVGWRIMAQSRLEPLLREFAEKSPYAALRFSAEATSLEQDDTGVILGVTAAEGDATLRAKYAIGCDGGRFVGPALGIGFTGPRNLMDMVSVHFTDDLTGYRDPRVLMSWFVNPDHGGSVETGFIYPVGPWDAAGNSKEHVFVFANNFGADAEVDEGMVRQRMRDTLGIAEFDPEIHYISHWFIQSVVADSFRHGRCFLAGDAAHQVPPWGALGMNTGLQDIQNLVWKLAAALESPQAEGLLDSYEPERKPVAEAVAKNALDSFTAAVGIIDAALGIEPTADPAVGWSNISELLEGDEGGSQWRQRLDEAIKTMDCEFHAHGADCGFFYHDGAFGALTAGEPEVVANPLLYTPRVLPGHHLPHFWLRGPADDQPRGESTVDLPAFRHWVLLTDAASDVWDSALAEAEHSPAHLTQVVSVPGSLTSSDHDAPWATVREVGPGGAILVRPDGFVAWRWNELPEDPRRALDVAFKTVFAGSGDSAVPAVGAPEAVAG